MQSSYNYHIKIVQKGTRKAVGVRSVNECASQLWGVLAKNKNYILLSSILISNTFFIQCIIIYILKSIHRCWRRREKQKKIEIYLIIHKIGGKKKELGQKLGKVIIKRVPCEEQWRARRGWNWQQRRWSKGSRYGTGTEPRSSVCTPWTEPCNEKITE